jgi:AcrR family transcriptional regulator
VTAATGHVHESDAPVKKRLLDTAERLFAERGFALASVREITAAAACNIAAVNYYFKGKDGLYQEVFRRRLAALRENRIASIRRAVESTDRATSLEAVLRAFTDAFVEPFVAHGDARHLLALISREMVEPHLPREMFRKELAEPVRQVTREALARVVPGISDHDAELCTQSLVAQLTHVLTMHRMLDDTGQAGPPRAWLDEITAHIVRFSAAGIRSYVTGESR